MLQKNAGATCRWFGRIVGNVGGVCESLVFGTDRPIGYRHGEADVHVCKFVAGERLEILCANFVMAVCCMSFIYLSCQVNVQVTIICLEIGGYSMFTLLYH